MPCAGMNPAARRPAFLEKNAGGEEIPLVGHDSPRMLSAPDFAGGGAGDLYHAGYWHRKSPGKAGG